MDFYFIFICFRIYTKVSAFIDWIERNRATTYSGSFQPSFPTADPIFQSVTSSSTFSTTTSTNTTISSSTTYSSYVNANGRNCPIGFVGDNCEIGKLNLRKL